MASADTYYRFETNGNCSVITLLPELNDRQWADIDRVATELEDRLKQVPSPRLLLDLTPLSYMGSAMVALNVRLYKSVNGRNGQMVVVNQHELVNEVLKLAGLTKLWTIVDSREKGFSALGLKKARVAATTTGSDPVSIQGNAILIAGIIGTIGAIIGLALHLSGSSLVSPKAAQLIEVGFAAIGFVVGTIILVNQNGMRRNIGIAILAICLLIVLGGIVAAPDRKANAAPSPSSTSPSAPSKPVQTATADPPAAATASAPATPAASTPAATPQIQGGLKKKKDKN